MKTSRILIGAMLAATGLLQGLRAQTEPVVQRLEYKEYAPWAGVEGAGCFVQLEMDFLLEGNAAPTEMVKEGRSWLECMQGMTQEDRISLLNRGIVNRVLVEKAFGKEYADRSFLMAAACYRDAREAEYRKNVEEMLDVDPDIRIPEYDFYVSGIVVDTGRMFLTYRLEESHYTGGAHPNSSVRYLNFDARGLVTVADLFGEDKLEVMKEVVFKALLSKEGVKTAEELERKSYFPEFFHVSDDFYVKGDSIVFVYSPYEIAAYSQGVVEIPVPFSALEAAGF